MIPQCSITFPAQATLVSHYFLPWKDSFQFCWPFKSISPHLILTLHVTGEGMSLPISSFLAIWRLNSRKQSKAWTAAEDKVFLYPMEAHCCSLSWAHSSICVDSQMSTWSFWELMARFLTWFTMQVNKFQKQQGKGKECGWDRQQNVKASHSVTTHTSIEKLHSKPEQFLYPE